MSQNNLNVLHERIFHNLKNKAADLEGDHSDEYHQYLKDFTEYSQRPYQKALEIEVLRQVKRSRFVFIGDFHTFDQSQKNLIRIIKHLQKENHKFKLFIEMVHSQDQNLIEAYRKHDITEIEFLDSINYHDNWRFPWGHYKPLIDICIKHDIEVFGVNSTGPLSQRDKFAAKIIKKHSNEYTSLILMGELHMAPNRLPQQVLDENTPFTIIHQNLDHVFFDLRSKGHDWKVIHFNDNEYSLQTSPPWMKYESQVFWLEGLYEDPDFDLHNYSIEKGVKVFSADTQEDFLLLANEFSQFMELETYQLAIDDFQLYDHTQIELIQDKIAQHEFQDLRPVLHQMLESGETFSLLQNNEFFCPSYNINRLTYLSGLHLAQCLSHKFHDNIIENFTNDRRQLFSHLVLHFGMGYLSSKVFNPYRKCDLYLDWLEKNQKHLTPVDAPLLINLFNSEFQEIPDLKHDLKQLFELAQASSHILIENFFEKIQKKELSQKELTTLFEKGSIKVELHRFFKKIFPQHEYKHQRKRFF